MMSREIGADGPTGGRRRGALATMAALSAMLCAACAVGPDFHRPAPPDVQGYVREPLGGTATAPVAAGAAQSFSAGAEVPARWWTGFGSPSIDRLVERAFQRNPTVDAAKAALRQAHESTAAQFGASFPVLQASYSPSRAENAIGTIAPTLNSGAPVYTLHTAQVSVGFVPDVFGLNRRAVESLASQEEAQRFQLEATYLTLASNVVAAAIQQAALKAQADAAEDIIRAVRRSLELLREQARLGYASGLDVASQESALAQAELVLPPLKKQLEQSRDLLAVLAGDLPAQGQPAQLDQATAQYRSVVLTAFQNVADSLYALQGDADALAASVKAEGAARKTLDLTRRQLDAGAVNVLALLSAQQAYQQTRISRVQAQAARLTDTAALYQALGGAPIQF